MSDELNGIHDKLDKMNDVMTQIQVSQARMEINVSEHIRRTEIAEEHIDLIRKELEPVKEHVSQVRAVVKFSMWIGGAIGTLLAAAIAYFKK